MDRSLPANTCSHIRLYAHRVTAVLGDEEKGAGSRLMRRPLRRWGCPQIDMCLGATGHNEIMLAEGWSVGCKPK